MCLLILRRHVGAQPQQEVCKDEGTASITQERTTYYRIYRHN